MNYKKIPIKQHYVEIKECREILRELKRTVDTDGCYCPYNKVYPHQAEVVHEIREILRQKIEKE